jgi:hypothetical protein
MINYSIHFIIKVVSYFTGAFKSYFFCHLMVSIRLHLIIIIKIIS